MAVDMLTGIFIYSVAYTNKYKWVLIPQMENPDLIWTCQLYRTVLLFIAAKRFLEISSHHRRQIRLW